MCIVQCFECKCCNALFPYSRLHLIPLKCDYFDGEDYELLWDRWDLVCRFQEADANYTLVYDLLCMNPKCLRRQSDYSPKIGEKIGVKCDSVHCNTEICNLKKCNDEEFCYEHINWHPEELTSEAPVFRVQLFNVADIRNFNRQC
jgi:hypothetical protein